MNSKNTKRALITSVLALVLCFSMLVGTTYAWFTDSVTSGNNRILAGNLDVELYNALVVDEDEKVTTDTKLFDGIKLWEPGVVAYENLTIANVGTLALKYQLAINFLNENATTDGYKLSQVLKVAFVEGGIAEDIQDDRDAVVAEGEKAGWQPMASFKQDGELLAGANNVPTTDTYGLVICWEPSAEDNNWNLNNGKTTTDGADSLHIDLGVTLVATQYTHENDSFGNDYDADADLLYCDVLATPETIDEILATAEEGMVIGLDAGTYGVLTMTQNNLTIVSKRAVVDAVNLNEKDGVTLDGLTFDAANATTVYRYKRPNMVDAGYVASITNTKTPKGANSTTVKNCTFTGTPDDVSVYVPICFEDQDRTSGPSTGIIVDNCVFECNAFNYIRLNYLYGSVVVTNNVFGGLDYSTAHNTINASGNSADWTVSGNVFYNWNVEKVAFSTNRNSATIPAAPTKLTVTNNEFINALDNPSNLVLATLAIKAQYNTSNCILDYSGNTANYGLSTLDTTATTIYKDNGSVDEYRFNISDLNGKIVEEGIVQPDEAKKEYDLVAPEGLMNLNDVLDVVHSGEGTGTVINLKSDVDLAGYAWEPIGEMWVTFNGNGHTISNLTAEGWKTGLFGYAGAVTINDLTLENVTSIGAQAGTFAGAGDGLTLNNCYLKGDNVVTYREYSTDSYTEVSGGIGAITGVIINGNLNVTIDKNATVTVTKNGISTSLTEIDNLIGYKVDGYDTNKGTVTNNGTIITGIVSADDLALIGKGGNFALMNDLDMSGVTWTSPVGQTTALTFDGNSYTISGWKTTGGALLVPKSNSMIVVKNLNLDNCEVRTSSDYAALLIGYSDATTAIVENCNVTNSVVEGSKYAGAILGWNSFHATISDCSVKGTSVTAGGSVGAIAGHVTADEKGVVDILNATVEGCTLKGEKVEKTGAVLGTANIGKTTITTASISGNTVFDVVNSTTIVGRSVPGSTGSLTVNGVAY